MLRFGLHLVSVLLGTAICAFPRTDGTLTIGSNDHAAQLRRENREVEDEDQAASIDGTATACRSSLSLGANERQRTSR